MGTKYSSQSISGYNASAPADDGTTSESNKVKWATVKTKIGDPVKTTVEAINSALVTVFDQSARSVSASDSTVAGDHNRTIQIASTITASITISLGDAATMAAGYIVTVANQSNVACVIDRVTASNTINGVTSTVSIAALESITFIVNSATNGYIIKSRDGAAKGAVTGSNLTMTTARLLGRTTASTGAIEEITVGSDLTLSGGAISVAPASDTLAGKIEIAIQSEMETGTSTTLAVTPGRQQYHPASPKAWTLITVSGGTPTSTVGYNVSSITDGGTGDFTINFTTAFSTANYGFTFGQETDAGTATYIVTVNYDTAPTASAIRVANLNIAGAAATDPRVLSAAFFGDY